MKSLTRIISVLLLLCLAVGVLASCEIDFSTLIGQQDKPKSYASIQSTVNVSVADGAHFTVTSQNPVRATKGSNVGFTVSVEEGYEVVGCSDGARYYDGILSVYNVKYPTTVTLTLKMKRQPIITPEPEPEPEPEPKPEPLPPPEETETVVLEAPEAEEGFHFICWTADVTAEEGGEVITDERAGSFEVKKGVTPVANYVDNGHFVILYRTNGGTTADGKDYHYQTFTNKYDYMPNTIHQNGTFVREGYVLERYTENKDGSGDYTTLGGKIETNENGFVELWLKWGRSTAAGIGFTLYENENGEVVASITEFASGARSAVIPEFVEYESEKYRVERICEGAFRGRPLRSLTLPHSILTVENGAFDGCIELTELTMHDNIMQISDASFTNGTSIKTLYLNAGRLPTHVDGTGMFGRRYQKIRRAYTEGRKKIIVISGSSSMHGFLAREMEEYFDGEWAVINHGTNASANMHFYISSYMRFLGEGDIIIHAPENSSGAQLGDSEITFRLLRQIETTYETVSFVDLSEYTKFFDALSEFNQTVRNTMSGKSYERGGTFINEYTDLNANGKELKYAYKPDSYNACNPNVFSFYRTTRLNELYERVKATGAEMYYSFAPVNRDACSPTARDRGVQNTYMSTIRSLLDYTVISDIKDYMLDSEYMYDSDFHPNTTGAIIRTERLIADLERQLILEGRWDPDKKADGEEVGE